MAYVARIEASAQGADRVTHALIAGLEIEFGPGAGSALAARFLAAEEADFLWDARVEERWMGGYESIDGDDIDLDRVAIVGRLQRRWYVAQIIVDGDGCAHGLISRRNFPSAHAARQALADAR